MYKQLYGSKNAYDPMEYMLKAADIEPDCLTLSDAAAELCSARHVLKIARYRTNKIIIKFGSWVGFRGVRDVEP